MVDRLVGVRGNVADEAAGERVAGPRGIDDLLERVGGQREEAVGGHEDGAVLALLGDDRRRPPGEDLARRGHQVRPPGELAHLGVVEHDAVDLADDVDERVAGDVDPQVHRVQRHEAGVDALRAHLRLQLGLDVGQEDDVGGTRGV